MKNSRVALIGQNLLNDFNEPYRLICSNCKWLFLIVFVYLSLPKSAKPK